ncbi:MAG: hypothetical protein IJF41_02685 [Clostridia bacterium]|nr:hypothetical protein [Clostridia bacterium]
MERIKGLVKKHIKWLGLLALEALFLFMLLFSKRAGLFYVEKLFSRSVLALLAINICIALLALDRARRGKPSWDRGRRTALILLCFALAASLPLYVDYINFIPGHDHEFHLIRIEGIVEGIRDGQFPVRIHPETLSGYGYGASIFYPELLLYFPAFLRIMGLPVRLSYQIFCFFVNLATAAMAYHSFKGIFASRRLGLVGSFFMTFSLYRLTCLYTRGAVGEYTAMIFLPLVAWGIYRILARPCGGKENSLAFMPLMLGMTGLLYTHSLTAAIAALVLAIVCLICIRRVFQRERFFQLLLAVAGTLLLTAAYLGPMLHAGTLVETSIFTDELQRRFVHAINPYQLFPLFPNAVGISNWHDSGVPGEMPLGLGLAGLVAMCLWCFFCKRKQGDDLNAAGRISFWILAALLVMTTELFPWEGGYQLGGILARAAGTLQFPWRLLSVSSLLLALVACSLLREANGLGLPELNRALALTLCLLTLITACSYMDELMQGATVFRPATADDLDRSWGVMNGEFLPAAASRDHGAYTGEPTMDPGLRVEQYRREGTKIELYAENIGAGAANLTLPRLSYPGYEAETEQGEALPLWEGEGGLLTLTLPAGFAGGVQIRYQPPILWRIFEGITLLSALFFIFLARKNPAKGRAPAAEPYPLLKGEA